MSLKSILASAGLGQSDLLYVFEETIKRLDQRELTNPDRRVGQAQAIDEMLQVLQDEDVMSSSTKKEIKDKLDRWLRKGPKKS